MEVRTRMPLAARKFLSVKAGELTLQMESDARIAFDKASEAVAKALDGIESRPVIPREIEDILGIKTSERHRWLKDGRLPSAGTKTVKLRGRARKITFHVFDPRVVEGILDAGLVDTWREEDAEATAERRRQALWKAKLKRQTQSVPSEPRSSEDAADDTRFHLRGWAEFERESGLG